MAETTEVHSDAREIREPVTPEVAGPVSVPELPPSGDVDVATINAATDAFINGIPPSQEQGSQNPRVEPSLPPSRENIDTPTLKTMCEFLVI